MTIATPPSHVTLPSGDRMPVVGLGCWQSEPEALTKAVAHAIKVGYRHIDGATIYGNEKALGEGIKLSGVDRKDIWVTTKLWNDDHRQEDVMKACRRSLELLGLEYIDLWLMHYPAATDTNPGDYNDINVLDIPYTDTWKAMEECVDAGLVRNIGISNYSKTELDNLWNDCRIKPAVHQLERHPYLPQNAFMKYHKEIGLHVTAYSPLGNTNPSFNDRDSLPPIQKNTAVVALAEKYGISPANVLISLQVSQGCSVLPKSVTPSRIEENLKIVQHTEEDIKSIEDATKGQRARYCDFSDIIGYKYYVGLDDSD
ncbi:hypothetical protein I302_102683 [Kwoniella bestiolae CBS 10118]|uniref:NADP-dependent oxidoreductase domain-containing protein n=1 Tax=Kwoniella bestiolae CBS 10118 TaxID=1296100 RepID=A0A1B9GFN8_9TREE|nr:hypothetical protein I302_01377 [Kwoniella bestiolae CBS 10118]OCF29864.1 hypothetical protein I302_01377 [Kwoniella bestiolae CBS 10118]